MKNNQKDIEEIKEQNRDVKSLYWIWPAIFFFLALIIAALAYNHTIY